MAGAKHIELPAVVVPPHLWLRSGRPTPGKILQVALPAVFIAVGLLASRTALRVSFVLAGLGLYLLLPAMIIGRLDKLGREIQAADRKTAGELLRTLRTRALVQYFAPHAWLTLQEGILSLKTGDGKVAAANFAETARLVRQPDAVMLISAQAHALVLAGERAEARDLLQRLARENLISPRDQLDLGIVLLLDSKKNRQAQAYVEAARKTIGDHPRVLAAMALALQKAERIDEASELLEQVQVMITKGADSDPLIEDLTKRVRKALQAYIEAQLRRERRNRSRRTTIVVSSDLAASEIVSGEIGAGDQAQLDNPTTGFKPAEMGASIISSKSVDEELTSAERKMLNIPESRTRREPTSSRRDASQLSGPNISFEESAAHPAARVDDAKPAEAKKPAEPSLVIEEVPPARSHPTPEVPSGPLVDSLLTALFDEPEKPELPASSSAVPGPPGLINPAVPVSVPVVPSTGALPAASTTPPLAPVPPPENPDVDVPVFRRKQTHTAIPVAADRSSSNPATLATPPPPTPTFAGGGKMSALPTRSTRHEGNPIPGTAGAPRTTTPVFKAPNLSKTDDDETKR
jgi:tetratricopeptide (TPR) repeat protein